MSDPTLVKKITMKVLAGIDRAKTKEETIGIMKKIATEKPDFCAIAGDVTGHGNSVTQFGESTYLVGSFIAVNRHTCEVFKSSKCFVPKDLTDSVVAAFKSRADASAALHFSAIISCIADSSAGTGYTFISQHPIADPASINRQAEMMAKLMSLPAPKQIGTAKKAS